MQKSKSLIIIFCGVILVAILSAVLVLRDNTSIIDMEEFSRIVSDSQDFSVMIDESYIYLNDGAKKHKIARALVDLSAYPNLIVRVKNNSGFNNILSDIGILVIVLLGIAVLVNALSRTIKRNNADSKQIRQNLTQDLNREANANSFANPIANPTIIADNSPNITFDDIAGIKEVKDDLLEIIDYLKLPKKYQDKGIALPKGILLIGPPGVGKTMIAKAIANEAKVPFFYQSGSSFAQIYVGVGAKRVRELFYQAKRQSPSIIFIDEIDAVGKARGEHRNDERETTLNQLLTEMDGFVDSSGVIVVGATNRVEILDSALLRSGRFDRRIYIDLPDFEERVKIIELYLRGKNHSVNINEVAKMSVGFSGAALASLVNEASLNALRRGAETITNDDFFASQSKIEGGIKKQLTLSAEEKNILSLYQAAKALCAYWCEMEFDKVSLLGDGIKNADKNLRSKTDLLNQIKVALSGNVVLNMNVGEVYTNCKDDIQIAKIIATEMCEDYGMGERMLISGEDILEILNAVQDELKIFFTSSKNALLEAQKLLLENEKITKYEISAIFKKSLDSLQ
ncbi:AAA family ATPase [Helicobacter sp. 23-1045]